MPATWLGRARPPARTGTVLPGLRYAILILRRSPGGAVRRGAPRSRVPRTPFVLFVLVHDGRQPSTGRSTRCSQDAAGALSALRAPVHRRRPAAAAVPAAVSDRGWAAGEGAGARAGAPARLRAPRDGAADREPQRVRGQVPGARRARPPTGGPVRRSAATPHGVASPRLLRPATSTSRASRGGAGGQAGGRLTPSAQASNAGAHTAPPPCAGPSSARLPPCPATHAGS